MFITLYASVTFDLSKIYLMLKHEMILCKVTFIIFSKRPKELIISNIILSQ